MSRLKKILSLIMCLVLVANFASYADTVVIGAAPTSTNDKAVTQNAANTSYLQNQYTGPGLLPSSSNNLGTSPLMQNITYDQSLGQQAAMTDTNGVANSGPTSTTIKSPKSNNAVMSMDQSAVITNSAAESKQDVKTADKGPTIHEIDAPKAGGETQRVSSGAIVNGEYVEGYGPAGAINSSDNRSSDVPSDGTANGASAPSYTGGQTTTTQNTQNITYSDIIKYDAVDVTTAKPSISAPAAIVLNASTRQIYFSKGGFTAYPPAALANLVTAHILLSYRGLDDVLAVSQNAVTGLESGATTAGLKAGDVIKVRDAIGAMFVKSCCDVANVVAENVSGNIPAFVALMNQTVKNWGCVGTTFMNPTGLNNDAQVTNTYDMAIIMDKVTQNAALKQMLTLTAYQLPATSTKPARTLTSKNLLLTNGNKQYYKGISASRMGYTSKAKYTMASEVDYNGNRLIAVVLKANGTQFADTTKLLNFAKVACLAAATSGAMTYSVAGAPASQVATTLAAGDTQGSWAQDDKGWYFLKIDGSRANNEWVKQNGKMFCVDSTGYMVTGWREFSNGKLYYFDQSNGEFRYNTWVNTNTGAYYLQADGSLAKADSGRTSNITTSVGTYTIDDTGKAIAKVK